MAKIHNGWISRSFLSCSHRSVTNGCLWFPLASSGSQSLDSLKMNVVIETEVRASSIQEGGWWWHLELSAVDFLRSGFPIAHESNGFSDVADITYNCVCYTHNSRAILGPLQFSHSASYFIWGVMGGSKVLVLEPDRGEKKKTWLLLGQDPRLF